MTNSVVFWWVVLVVYPVLIILAWRKAYQKGKWKRLRYSMKDTYNYIMRMVNIILSIYFIIFALIPMNQIISWINKQELAVKSNLWVFKTMPIAYVVIVIAVCVWIITHGLIPYLQYNEEEKLWDKEKRQQFQNKIKGWLGIKPKAENIAK